MTSPGGSGGVAAAIRAAGSPSLTAGPATVMATATPCWASARRLTRRASVDVASLRGPATAAPILGSRRVTVNGPVVCTSGRPILAPASVSLGLGSAAASASASASASVGPGVAGNTSLWSTGAPARPRRSTSLSRGSCGTLRKLSFDVPETPDFHWQGEPMGLPPLDAFALSQGLLPRARTSTSSISRASVLSQGAAGAAAAGGGCAAAGATGVAAGPAEQRWGGPESAGAGLLTPAFFCLAEAAAPSEAPSATTQGAFPLFPAFQPELQQLQQLPLLQQLQQLPQQLQQQLPTAFAAASAQPAGAFQSFPLLASQAAAPGVTVAQQTAFTPSSYTIYSSPGLQTQPQAIGPLAAGGYVAACPPPCAFTSTTAPRLGATTQMLRNIPVTYDRERLLADLDHRGFSGSYDFFYLPIDFQTGNNVGYAFINFVSEQEVGRFRATYEGLPLSADRSNKICAVCDAQKQGLQQNIEHYRNSPVMGMEERYHPLLFVQGVRQQFPGPTKPLKQVRQRTTKATN